MKNNNLVHSEKYGEYVINIYFDTDASNPRKDYDHLGTIYHVHRDRDLGEEASQEEIQEIIDNPDYFSLPVYMIDHSSVSLSTKAFGCPWDSGQVGIIAVLKSKALKEWSVDKWTPELEEKIAKLLRSEIKEFSDYLGGNVYGFEVVKPAKCCSCGHCEDEFIDSCWGYIGDHEFCLDEARNTLPKEAQSA